MDSKVSDCFIQVVTTPLDMSESWRFINVKEHGGNAFFVGSIRETNLGKDVQKVQYDIYEAFFIKALHEYFTTLTQQLQCSLRLYTVHYKGELMVTEPSVLIAVSTPHRKEALASCEQVIHFIKHKTTVWKKEFYTSNDDSGWVEGHSLCRNH